MAGRCVMQTLVCGDSLVFSLTVPVYRLLSVLVLVSVSVSVSVSALALALALASVSVSVSASG